MALQTAFVRSWKRSLPSLLPNAAHGTRRFAYVSQAKLSPYAAETFLNGESSPYVEQMYESWLKDRNSVHASWNAYFTNVSRGMRPGTAYMQPPVLQSTASSRFYAEVNEAAAPTPIIKPDAIPYLPAGASFITLETLPSSNVQTVHDTSRIIQMIRGYQIRGHEMAKIDPLGLPPGPPFTSIARRAPPTNLDYKYYGFTESDLDKVFDCRVPGLSGFLSPDREPRPLRQIISRLEETYCGSIGVEYMHISDQAVCNFIRQMVETPQKYSFSSDMKRKILVRTARAQLMENFCTLKFATSKRFGVDGCESMIVGLKAITKKAAREGINSVVFGMPHRGRLNVLVNVMHKPMQQMMCEFQGITGFGGTEWGNSGDVKYHLGVEFDHWDADSQRYIHMGVLANPSHLEAVNPLVLGQARAQQYYSGDEDRSKVLPIIIHGDASFAGQGVIYETLQMSKLPSYCVGGTVHIVVNNQVGYTTDAVDGMSGKYCTDIAKAIDAPVFHVNADDPEAVTFVSELAMEYRQRFKSDVMIDLVGYRRFGHNEMDMPRFTQPHMYTLIARHEPILDIYSKKLMNEGVVTQEKVDEIKQDITNFYEREYEKSKTFAILTQPNEYLPQWQHMMHPSIPSLPQVTGVAVEHLKELGKKLYSLPDTFTPHPTIGKTFKARLECMDTGENVDFGIAETLAYASLLSDGFHVRLAGEDTQRGTFSHRHAVVHDQVMFQTLNLFESLETPHKMEVCNSLLSEYAAMGFEVGYAMENPDTLCVWEAQFGDFANGGQIIIDQFIVSGESKWNRQCGVALMLPHGYDGAGPEHSSCRVERFLQMCDDREDIVYSQNLESPKTSVTQQHNIQVIMPSTPANMFHALRRQMIRRFRKPLIICSPKQLLKLRAAYCTLDDMGEGTRFQRYIPDNLSHGVVDTDIKRLIVCSGQVYYNLIGHREKLGDKSVAVARMEQLSPFPFQEFAADVSRYPNLEDIVWAQEEHMNAGPWFYTSKRLEAAIKSFENGSKLTGPIYAGRDVNASVAVGDAKLHAAELNQLVTDAFNLDRKVHSYTERYQK